MAYIWDSAGGFICLATEFYKTFLVQSWDYCSAVRQFHHPRVPLTPVDRCPQVPLSQVKNTQKKKKKTRKTKTQTPETYPKQNLHVSAPGNDLHCIYKYLHKMYIVLVIVSNINKI